MAIYQDRQPHGPYNLDLLDNLNYRALIRLGVQGIDKKVFHHLSESYGLALLLDVYQITQKDFRKAMLDVALERSSDDPDARRLYEEMTQGPPSYVESPHDDTPSLYERVIKGSQDGGPPYFRPPLDKHANN